jgi:RNA polymerase sigma factor (TIGR02999 family)
MICSVADVTQILNAIEAGDPHAASELLPLVYDELRNLATARLAGEKPGQTLTATALVHEAYMRLVGGGPLQEWNGRGHFFAAAAQAMRRILVNRARDKGRLKRGGGRRHVELADLSDPLAALPDDLLDLDDALERLAAAYPRCAELVNLRFFAGLTHEQASAALGISPSTADRDWRFAQAWLLRALGGD